MPRNAFGGRKANALKNLALASTALVCLGLPIPASAAEIWTGAASTDWFTAGNWNPAAVPTSSDDVMLDPVFPHPTVVNAANAAAHYLFVGTISSYSGSLTITNGGTLSDTAGYLGYASDASGTVSVTGAGSVWSNSSDLFLALGTNSNGTLTISSGGAVSDKVGHVGYGPGTGTVTVDGPGSTWTNSGDLYIAEFGTGTLDITNGGVVSNAMGTIGWHVGSTGTVTVDGAGSTWTNSSHLYVGDQGTGALKISNGGKVSNLSGILGNLAGSSGTATVDGAGSTWANAALAVGNAGFGALTVTNGGAVTSSVGYAGYAAGSKGLVAVDGVGSAWTNTSDLFIGFQGQGTLTVSNGGAVSNTIGMIGAQTGSTGIAFVDGAGSIWTNSSNLIVGNLGNGALGITHGGVVSNTWAAVGAKTGSIGMAFVDGTGSTWANTGELIVGQSGTGTLDITNGGAVSNQTGSAGYDVGSMGTVTVDGPGSSWTNSGDLFLGFKGAGTLQVADGGHVLNQAALLAVFETATATVTVDGAGSSWSTDDNLILGSAGHAALSISSGGSADADSVFVGQAATATGAVTVDGVGSKWTNKNGMYLGGLGIGTLAVTNGGVASGGGTYMAFAAGATGQATVDGPASLWEMHGDLDIGFGGTASVTLSNGGTALVDGSTVIASQAGSVGALNIGGAAGSAAAGAGVLDSATLQFGSGTGTLNFNHTSANNGFASAISGLGTINQIAGNTKLTSNSSGFTGTTNVLGGGLYVNGSLGGAINVTGGLLGGSGTVGNVTIASGGTFAPGNSIGTINVSNTAFSAGSTYAVEVEIGGTSDRISATGTVTIGGGTVDVIPYPDYATGTTYTIVTAAGGVTGTFDKASLEGGSIFIAPTLTYDANNVYLNLAKASFASVGLTPNQIATGGGAESLGAGNPLFDAIFALPSEAAAQDAFDQLSGEIHASAKGLLIEDSGFIRDAANSRIAAAFGDAGAAALPVIAYGEGGPEMVAADTDRFAVWGQAFGSTGSSDSDGNAAAFDRSTGGLLAGADTLVGGWRVGVLGGYSHSSFNADDRNSSGKSDSYHLGLYGGTNWGAIAFRTGAAYSWSSLSTKRSVAFTGFADQLSANYDAGTAQMFGDLAYKAETGGSFKFEPFANLAYVSLHTDGFSETGGAAALTSAGASSNVTFATLGLRSSTDFGLGGVNATARGMLGWRHAFGDVTPTSSFAFAGGDAFTIAGVPIARDAAVIEAGIDMKVSPNATLGLSYSGQFGGGAFDNGAKANLSVKF
ncbi:autotransporter outer membrane beta-barrel domain-containing protein [Mesorhizobium sp. B2-5-9]|uniref:autotransporter outer membrane beta-barrel domain-containing protein n=1 Tax=unclassified Mesorhizobium TaxID=325217 RepID=UPI0011268284|nr:MULTISPECIES: autotransporter domain-containing protein [unclassified Mesorhizobium]TPK05865.1 autotransporter outer membrane beta-barrel domain-containing protein [Mesorhizobium sp. B2-5-9]TPK82837.1 autotransporter outer membrane beta-barrel domain-containing protein [Mesorhizobium sp. B2-4-13]